MRFVKVFLGLGLVTALAFAVVQPVHADPHAVFWTVVGQQQLFFNVLAALNQADYVESLDLRNQLAQKRRDAGYVPSSSTVLRETQTDLSDVLTRSVTLEGQDLATAERADEYAQEVVRERQIAELFEKYCQKAYGVENCQLGQAQQNQNQEKRHDEPNRAFVQDIVGYESIPALNGALASLLSGTEDYQKLADQVVQEAKDGGQVLPLAYSSDIAAARQNLTGASRDVFEAEVKATAAKYIQPGLNVEQWSQYVTVDGSGDVAFQAPSSALDNSGRPASPDDIIQAHLLAMNQELALSPSLDSIAQAAQERVASQLQTVDGTVPDRVQKVQAGIGGDEKKYGEIRTLITSPINGKVGLQREFLPLLAQLIMNPKFVDPSQIDNPAGKAAVDRQGQPALQIGDPLEAFSKADVLEKGVLPRSGIIEKEGLAQDFFQNFLDKFAAALEEWLNNKPNPE